MTATKTKKKQLLQRLYAFKDTFFPSHPDAQKRKSKFRRIVAVVPGYIRWKDVEDPFATEEEVNRGIRISKEYTAIEERRRKAGLCASQPLRDEEDERDIIFP